MKGHILMKDHIPVIYAAKHFEDKITYEIISTFTPKRNHLNVWTVAKDFVSPEHWQFIEFYIWTTHLTVVLHVAKHLTKGLI